MTTYVRYVSLNNMGYILGHNLSLWINLKPIQTLIIVYLYSCIIDNSSDQRLEIHTFYFSLYFSSIFHIFKLDIKKSDHVSIWNFYYKFLIIKSWYIDFTNTTINQWTWIYIKRDSPFRSFYKLTWYHISSTSPRFFRSKMIY